MKSIRISLAAVLCAVAASAAVAQSTEGQCILAGRLADTGGWAPRFEAVQLLGAEGRPVRGASREALAGVRQARLAQPALLARCNGGQALARGDDNPTSKAPAPALSPGVVEVEAVSFPPMGATGGVLVELRVRAPAERVVLVQR